MILVTGSLAYDHIMDFPGRFVEHIMPDKIHMLNVSFLVPEMRKSFGGTAGNIAYTLSLLGIKVGILGIIGKDFKEYREFLEKYKIDTSLLQLNFHYYTSTAFGITDGDDNQIWGFYPGADNVSHKLSVKSIKKKLDFAIVAPNNPKAMLKYAGEYKKLGIPYLFDPGMQLRWFTKNDLLAAFSGAKIIIGNDYEVGFMEKMTKMRNLHALSQKGKIIITTLGDKGSRISADGKTTDVHSAQPKNTSDPSGAGDAYRAGFMAGYMRSFDIKTCGQMGSLASVYTVEKYGTTTHYFTKKEFCRRYKSNFNEELKL